MEYPKKLSPKQAHLGENAFKMVLYIDVKLPWYHMNVFHPINLPVCSSGQESRNHDLLKKPFFQLENVCDKVASTGNFFAGNTSK